jgi:serine/threonine protein kinase
LSLLHYIHQQHVIHRDIKADNVMLDRRTNRIVLIDFGACAAVNEGGGLTKIGFVTKISQLNHSILIVYFLTAICTSELLVTWHPR